MTNSNCYDHSCSRDCCNYYGYCPSDYSHGSYNSYYTSCHYYYDSYHGIEFPYWAIGPICVGVFFIFCIVCSCIKSRQAQNQMEVV